ncbi:hypothetical protein C2845_PM14G02680 [Panicum miliaceum]|uniref:Uncharacterized protein n=1 Tax=Panicum miliaceum TaxID=4540 RepID=A0A3L6PL75_PANMI|nr:hypothetical protein C2845_PM14G02680 [Panicum miliaceum]
MGASRPTTSAHRTSSLTSSPNPLGESSFRSCVQDWDDQDPLEDSTRLGHRAQDLGGELIEECWCLR